MFRDFGRRLQRDIKRAVDARLKLSEQLSGGRIKVIIVFVLISANCSFSGLVKRICKKTQVENLGLLASLFRQVLCALWLTLVEIKFVRKSTQVFHPLATQRKSRKCRPFVATFWPRGTWRYYVFCGRGGGGVTLRGVLVCGTFRSPFGEAEQVSKQV